MTVQTPEPNVAGAYCALSDLRKGDIRLPSYMGDGTGYIQTAAEEIDIALGGIYETPITIPDDVQYRPSKLALKKINWLLASGRLILDLNASAERDNQHAYGMGMLKEGLEMLKAFATGERVLAGATRINSSDPEQTSFSGPQVFNEDTESLVASFYRRGSQGLNVFGMPIVQPQPYGYSPSTVI